MRIVNFLVSFQVFETETGTKRKMSLSPVCNYLNKNFSIWFNTFNVKPFIVHNTISSLSLTWILSCTSDSFQIFIYSTFLMITTPPSSSIWSYKIAIQIQDVVLISSRQHQEWKKYVQNIWRNLQNLWSSQCAIQVKTSSLMLLLGGVVIMRKVL
jgi:hypothetical protein